MSTARWGFTIVELLLVAVLGVILLTAAYQVLVANQRTYAAQSAKAENNQTTRSSLEALFSELRELDPSDLLGLTDDFVTLRAQREFGLVCEVLVGPPFRLDVVPLGDEFEVGDSLHVFAENDVTRMDDDTWITGAVSASASTADCRGRPAQRLSFVTEAPGFSASAVRVGGPVRRFVHYGYGLVESRGKTYMGRVAPDGSVEPLVGPLPATVRGQPAVEFIYLDDAGTPTIRAEEVAQIEVRVRTRSEAHGPDGAVVGDSLVSRVHLRN